MKEKIIDLSIQNGIDLIGFCSIKNNNNYLKELYKYQSSKKYKTSFQTGSVDDKVLTGKKYNKYSSAIVIGMSYNKQTIFPKSNEVVLSSCAFGKDYHIVLKEKLELIANYIKSLNGMSEIYVDNNSLDERNLAYHAGLGFYGMNHLLISEEYGSYFFIGVLLTDFIFEYDNPLNKKCIGCKMCIDKCPMNVLGDKVLNGNKCLSFLTQKKSLTEEETQKINNCVYGCDICQEVCPHNKITNSNDIFKYTGIELIDCNYFLSMNNNEYKKLYSQNSSCWRGKNIIDRNVKLYKKNRIDYKKLL